MLRCSVNVPVTSLRVLEHEYTFDHRIADCASCPLQPRRDETICLSQRPTHFNGLMIVGEGPGANEARLKTPFIGRSGGLLDELLKKVGLKRDECYVSNATLCCPPPMNDKEKAKTVEFAVAACRSRLVAEIEHYQPRVIVAFGGAALSALTGRFVSKMKQFPLFQDNLGQPLNCPQCDGEMTLAWWQCPDKECKHANLLPPRWDVWCGQAVEGAFWCQEHVSTDGRLVASSTQRIAVKPRKKRCPTCLGKKTKKLEVQEWKSDHRISAVAGALFRGRFAADYEAMDKEAQVDLPIAYMIPTWHPAFMLRQPEGNQKKTGVGQFLVNAAIAHLEKAARLLKEEAAWSYEYVVVPDHLTRYVAHLADDAPEKRLAIAQAEAQSTTDFVAQTAARGQLFTSCDIETDNKDPWTVTDIRCIGFHNVHPTDARTQAEVAFVVNTSGRRRGDPLVEAIVRWLEDPTKIKVFQNGLYDVQVIWNIWNAEVRGYKYDTLVAHNAVHSDEPHDLQHIACTYTDTPPWKPTKVQKEQLVYESSEQLHKYNGRDVYNTSLAIRRQLVELDSEKARFVHDLDLAMFHCAKDMERAGMPISPERWNRWAARADFYSARAKNLMRSFLGKPDFEPPLSGATKELLYVLFDKAGPCKLTPTRYTDPSAQHPMGQPSTEKAALLAYKGHPFVDLLLDFRRWNKVRSTYIEGMPVSADWRLRFRWKPLGARTGRWSTGDGTGNAQNWFKRMQVLLALFEGIGSDGKPFGGPHRLEIFPGDLEYLTGKEKTTVDIPGIRDAVVVPKGRKLVGGDLSQAELRVLGALSGDKKLISLCVNADESRKLEPDYDPHSYGCKIAFGDGFMNADTATKKILRDLFKRVIYGSFYGAGADTIWQSIYDGGYEGPPIDIETVEHILQSIFRAFPDVRPWRENALREAKKTGMVMDALIGRRREFPLLLIDATVVYNFAIQATTASTMNMSLLELRHSLPSVDPTAMILAQVHDAIYIECAEDKAEVVGKLLEQCMSKELVLVPGAQPMPLPASAHIADDWLEAA